MGTDAGKGQVGGTSCLTSGFRVPGPGGKGHYYFIGHAQRGCQEESDAKSLEICKKFRGFWLPALGMPPGQSMTPEGAS